MITEQNAGLHMTPNHVYYFGEQGPFPSVTTILDVIDKPALVGWAKRTVAEFAVKLDDQLLALIDKQGSDEAVKYLKELPDYVSDSAASLGSSVHLLADMASRGAETAPEGFEVSKEQIPYLAAFRDFLGHYGASSIVSSEKAIISFGDRYAGTYDLLMLIDGEMWLVDIKTNKGFTYRGVYTGVYPETALQLIAYGYAEHIILPNDPTLYPMPKIDHYAVLHLRPDAYPVQGWRLIEYMVTERDYIAFLAARELFAWQQEGRFKSL